MASSSLSSSNTKSAEGDLMKFDPTDDIKTKIESKLEKEREPTDTSQVLDAGILDEDKSRHISSDSAQSPDISLSLQTTLRYCDVETESNDHKEDSQETSSDSEQTFDDAPATHEQQQFKNSFYEKLSVTCQNLESTVASLQKPVKSEESTSLHGHEENASQTIPEETQQDISGVSRPETLLLSHPVNVDDKNIKDYEQLSHVSKQMQNVSLENQQKSDVKVKDSESSIKEQDNHGAYSIESSGLSPNLLQGIVVRKGDMIEFVADNLEQMIKQSSPLTHTDSTGSQESRRSSVRSIASASSSTSFATSSATSSGVSHSPNSLLQQSPDDIPPIDASAVLELENHARRVADSLDLMMGNIRNNLHKMSAITIGCQDAYKRSVDITCDSVDTSIKTMYALMAKCEELSISMGPVDQLAAQIKEIKRILDLFEVQLTEK